MNGDVEFVGQLEAMNEVFFVGTPEAGERHMEGLATGGDLANFATLLDDEGCRPYEAELLTWPVRADRNILICRRDVSELHLLIVTSVNEGVRIAVEDDHDLELHEVAATRWPAPSSGRSFHLGLPTGRVMVASSVFTKEEAMMIEGNYWEGECIPGEYLATSGASEAAVGTISWLLLSPAADVRTSRVGRRGPQPVLSRFVRWRSSASSAPLARRVSVAGYCTTSGVARVASNFGTVRAPSLRDRRGPCRWVWTNRLSQNSMARWTSLVWLNSCRPITRSTGQASWPI